jgi:hypothetical protein
METIWGARQEYRWWRAEEKWESSGGGGAAEEGIAVAGDEGYCEGIF